MPEKKKKPPNNVLKFPGSNGGPAKSPPKKIEQDRSPLKLDFAGFAIAIYNHRLDEAGEILAALLSVDLNFGKKAASFYYHLYQQDPKTQDKAMGLRSSIENGNINESLMLLYELFQIQGPVAITAIDSLKKRLTQQ